MAHSSVFLLIGANEGDRDDQLETARTLIGKEIGKILAQSHRYETAAWGDTTQPAFYNQAIEVQTSLAPRVMLQKIQQIEQKMGRKRTENQYAARLIDIDILLYGMTVVDEKDLQIPHPELPNRNFALVPLMEIAGETEHPTLGVTIEDLYFECEDPLEVAIIFNDDEEA